MMRHLKRKLLLAFVPVPTHVDAAPAPHSLGQNKACPLLSPQQLQRAIARIEDYCAEHAAKIPWLMPEFTGTVRSMMRTMKLVGDTWDKRPHKLYAWCDVLSESHTLLHIICGKKFVIWGWAENEIQAQQWVLLYILSSAQDLNILHRAARHCAVKNLFLDPARATDWVLSNVTPEETSLVIRVPTAYQKLKWKSQELLNELKARVIVTFARHLLARWGRLMGCGMGVIVREVGRCTHTLSMPTMRGTRDMLARLVRQTPRWEHSSHGEVHMDDHYWSIQRTQVKPVFEWCLSRPRNARHGHGSFEFSLSRLHKTLDRLGHATDESFDIVHENALPSFLHWDLEHNTRLVLGPLILQQSEIGVAIGGFLSSWEAEM